MRLTYDSTRRSFSDTPIPNRRPCGRRKRVTLSRIFHNAEAKYYASNTGLKEHNESAAARSRPPHQPLSFGTILMHEGRGIHGGPMSETALWDLLAEEEQHDAPSGGPGDEPGRR